MNAEARGLWVEGEPVAKGRPRMTRSGHAYTPKRTERAEAAIRKAWIEEYGVDPVDVPVAVKIRFKYPTPKSWPMWKREQAGIYSLPKMSKPDIDNLVKTVMDALNGIAYKDDAQIYQIRATKEYTLESKASTYITISAINSEKDGKGRELYWRSGRKEVKEK